MSIDLNIFSDYSLESANYITFINPGLHPDRILTFHDFLYIIDGTWEIIEDENVYNLHSDDLIILAANRHHYGKTPCSANNRHMYIHVYPTDQANTNTIMPDTYNNSNHTTITPDTFNRQTNFKLPVIKHNFETVIHCQDNPRIKRFFEEIISVFWSDEELKDTRISLLFRLLLCELYRQQNKSESHINELVSQASHLVQTTPQTIFSCGEVARQLFICERTLNNHFKKAYGKTFYSYQMDIKLEMVHQYILNHPDSKLEEIAQNFGFCDAYHLGKNYKKKYGVSPKRHK